MVGCFECGAPSPRLRCSRCKLAKYCNPDCQKTDWKKTHKSLCRTYLESATTSGKSGSNLQSDPMPILLKSVGLISEDNFVKTMRERKDLFLELVSKFQITSHHNIPVSMDFTCSVVDMFDKLRIVADASFVVVADNGDQKTIVPHILVEVVDDDQSAINACLQNGGLISDEAFAKVVDTWSSFYEKPRNSNIALVTLACGNGLVDRVDELKYRLGTKGISGISLIPTVTF